MSHGHMLEPVNFMLIGLIGGLHAQLFEVTHFLRRHDELRPATNEILDGCVANFSV